MKRRTRSATTGNMPVTIVYLIRFSSLMGGGGRRELLAGCKVPVDDDDYCPRMARQ